MLWPGEQREVFGTSSSHLTFICFTPFCTSAQIQQKIALKLKQGWREVANKTNKKQGTATPWGAQLLQQISASALARSSCLSRLSKPGYLRARAAFVRTGLCTTWLSTSRGVGGLCALLDCSPSSTLAVKLCLSVIWMSAATHVPLSKQSAFIKKGENCDIITLHHYIEHGGSIKPQGKKSFGSILLV